jgi:hypothetical protein
MFYHSFPRPKKGQDGIQKGFKILESFLKSGILLVPDSVEYQREKDIRNNTPEKYYAVQSRFCLTQIDISELKAHEKYFGGFHLELTDENAYSLGAIPVFYLPKIEPGTSEWSLKKLAANYLYQLYELKLLCQDIQALGKIVENKTDRENVTVEGDNRATGKTQSYTINAKQLRDILDMLTMNMIPYRTESGERVNGIGARMDALLGALKGISSLLYPTDKDIDGKHEDLYYFRQREWRITDGISVNGKQLDRNLTTKEKKILMSIDSNLFGRNITYADRTERQRIDGCSVIPEILCETGLKPVQEFVERIIVPKEALEKARAIAKKNHFDPARVVDFVSAMELEAIKSEYEAAKNQRRIQLIRSAQALAEGMYKLSVENRVLP